MTDHDELLSLTRALAGELERRARHGQRHVEPLADAAPAVERPTGRPAAATPPSAPPTRPSAPAPRPAAAAPTQHEPPPGVPKPVHRRSPSAAGPKDMPAFRRLVERCMDCDLSAGPRGSGALHGRGAAQPLIAFVTDYAGPAERHYGKVLAPEAGQMIANMVTRGFGLSLGQVYVTAAVKCPLGQGCQPSPSEARACARHLDVELALAAPRTVVAFGAVAAAALGFSDPDGYERLRGRILPYKESTPLVVTAHPRDMLADPSLKAAAWQDLQLLIPRLTGS